MENTPDPNTTANVRPEKKQEPLFTQEEVAHFIEVAMGATKEIQGSEGRYLYRAGYRDGFQLACVLCAIIVFGVHFFRGSHE